MGLHYGVTRAQLAEASVTAAALDTEADGYSPNLICHRAFAHPADRLPTPCLEGEVQLIRHRAEGPEVSDWEHLLLDGSCQRHAVRERG